jgi:hypothetical protein
MDRVTVALLLIVLAIMWLLMRRRSSAQKQRVPKCHYIYGCTNNMPDWAYWGS